MIRKYKILDKKNIEEIKKLKIENLILSKRLIESQMKILEMQYEEINKELSILNN